MTRVVGVQKLNRKLGKIPAAVREEVRTAMVRSAREIADLAEVLVPQDTGRLAGSIGWTWGEAPRGALSLGKVATGGDMTITVYAGDREAFYARWVEFGTVKVAAQPFFFPAYRALRKRSKSRIRRAWTRGIKKAAAR